jgi:hypothetical protein
MISILIFSGFATTVAAVTVSSVVDWYTDRKWALFNDKMFRKEAGLKEYPTYKDTSTYKLYCR